MLHTSMLFSRKRNKAQQKYKVMTGASSPPIINVIRSNGPSVIIKDIESQGILSEQDYEFIKQSVNKPLRIFEVNWTRAGSISFLAVYAGETVITLFPSNGCTFEFV